MVNSKFLDLGTIFILIVKNLKKKNILLLFMYMENDILQL